ncbi:MAG: biotin/lipoyl-binding protein [Candidatus Poseidonia sp.]|nr:biotin/lipoyl-binding protein [Poseidonia sp.]
MQHTFSSPDGPIEVTLGKDDGAFALAGHRAILIGDGRLRVTLGDGRIMFGHVAKVGDVWWVALGGHTYRWERMEAGASAGGNEGGLIAPMPGKVLQVLVKVGHTVEAGQALMVLEAMKMEHRIVAPSDGIVTMIHFADGDQVEQGASLLEIEAESE